MAIPNSKTRIAHNLVDRVGHQYGRLTVISRAGSRGTAATWLCRCICGREKVVSSNALRSRYTRSCGCSRRTGPNSRPTYRCSHPPGAAAANNILKGYRGAARKRGLFWGLTDDEFVAITQRRCAYCGIPPSKIRRTSRNGTFTWNGIDRIDNAQGYTSGNVVTCCSVCNHAKCDMSQQDFLAWIARIISFSARR